MLDPAVVVSEIGQVAAEGGGIRGLTQSTAGGKSAEHSTDRVSGMSSTLSFGFLDEF